MKILFSSEKLFENQVLRLDIALPVVDITCVIIEKRTETLKTIQDE